jgi:hypothetical protein
MPTMVGGMVDDMQQDVATAHRTVPATDKAEMNRFVAGLVAERLRIADVSLIQTRLARIQRVEGRTLFRIA